MHYEPDTLENTEPTSPPSAPRRRSAPRRGAAAVFGLILMASLVVLLAVSLDFGYIVVSQTELRRSVDATAMAACWELYDQQSKSMSSDVSEPQIREAASAAAAHNLINQEVPHIGSSSDDFVIGHYDLSGGSFEASTARGANAVSVRLARQSTINGEVPLFFGALTGRDTQALQSRAIAAMFNTVKGFYAPPDSTETIPILPLALDLESWQDAVAGRTGDLYRVDSGTTGSGSDGFHECNLYPQGTGSPGNRGTVDVGGANNSTADLARQVRYGISSQDFVDLGKPLELDSLGVLELNGDTGISAGIKDELATIIGQTRIIPIFSKVTGSGNNAVYSIVRFEGVRVLDVKLTGPMSGKHVTVQPAKMIARHSILATETTQGSDYLVSPVMIVE